MKIIKNNKKRYIRQFLEFGLEVVKFEVLTMEQDDEGQTIIQANEVYWVYPMHQDDASNFNPNA